jgi:predicted SAM-dependent methyltransferase
MIKVQFGCGSNILEGWQNHDREVDITKPLPYDANSVDMILAEHVLEHVSGPKAVHFLLECHRILKPEGTIRICVPVLDNLSFPKSLDIMLNHGHELIFTSDSIFQMVRTIFCDTAFTGRNQIDGHWKVIGKEQDDMETCRIEGTKRCT